MNRQTLRAPPSWKAEPVGGCPASIIQTLPASVAAGSGTFWTRTCYLQRWTVFTALVCPWHSRHLVSGPKHGIRGIRTRTSRQKKKTRESVSWSHVAVKAPKGKCFFKLAIGQNLQNEGRALFLCIYLYYICTDFFFLGT